MDGVTETEKLLADVRARTGVEAYLVPRGGEETCISVPFGGGKLDVWVSGKGEAADREAKLIAYLLGEVHTAGFPADRQEGLKTILLGAGRWHASRFLARCNVQDGLCAAVDVCPDKQLENAYDLITHCLGQRDMVCVIDGTRFGVVKFLEEGQTLYEFGQFVNQSLYEELGVHASVGVGCEVASFSEIAESYFQAAAAVRMSNIFQSHGEVHSYREYLLVQMLEDLPTSRLKEYLTHFKVDGAEEILSDPDMAGTAEAFLESSLNLSETSRNLFMHRNTLSYRLDKIERATGLNLRKFSDAVTFRVLTIISRLLKK